MPLLKLLTVAETPELLAKFSSTIKIELIKEMQLYFNLAQISLFDKNSKERI